MQFLVILLSDTVQRSISFYFRICILKNRFSFSHYSINYFWKGFGWEFCLVWVYFSYINVLSPQVHLKLQERVNMFCKRE